MRTDKLKDGRYLIVVDFNHEDLSKFQEITRGSKEFIDMYFKPYISNQIHTIIDLRYRHPSLIYMLAFLGMVEEEEGEVLIGEGASGVLLHMQVGDSYMKHYSNLVSLVQDSKVSKAHLNNLILVLVGDMYFNREYLSNLPSATFNSYGVSRTGQLSTNPKLLDFISYYKIAELDELTRAYLNLVMRIQLVPQAPYLVKIDDDIRQVVLHLISLTGVPTKLLMDLYCSLGVRGLASYQITIELVDYILHFHRSTQVKKDSSITYN